MCPSNTDINARTITDLGLSEAEHGCACSGGGQPCGGSSPEDTASPAEYLVTGMTCSHCVASVIEEVSAVSGVERVSVDLVVGGASLVKVTSTGVTSTEPTSTEPSNAAAVREAIVGAGYALAG